MTQRKSLPQIVEEHVAAGTVELPVFDQTAIKLRRMVERGEYDPQAVERLVVSDPSLSSALLCHANSSFFGGIEKVLTVRDAIVRLGVRQVSELVLLSTLKRQYHLRDPGYRKLAQQLWRHAVGCGMGAQWLAKKLDGTGLHEAFLAGLLHDIGKLLLLRVIDDLAAARRLRFQPSLELVLELLDSLHCEHGRALMDHWNIPDTYADIVGGHHDEDYDESDTLQSIVRLVDIACNRLGIGIRGAVGLNLAACMEAQRLRVSEVILAELEIRLEDSIQLSK